MSGETLLRVADLEVKFPVPQGAVHAVNGVSFELRRGEALGIVGESGSGKSVTVQALMGLLPRPPARVGGSARFLGRDLLSMPESALRRVRGREIAMVFQDPMSALNPVLSVGLQLTEAMLAHLPLDHAAAHHRAAELLDMVGIADPVRRLRAFPHQFSGGQLQRVGIAMALACGPTLLIADEPTTALDVTVQAQIVELVAGLQRRLGMAIIWISHDLRLVAGLVDRVAVMYAGCLVESAPTLPFFADTAHPYSTGLLASGPPRRGGGFRLRAIPGSPPNLLLPPDRCAFAPRCDHAVERCRAAKPPLDAVSPEHEVACWEWQKIRTEPRRPTAAAAPVAKAAGGDARAGATPMLSVDGLAVHYPIRRGVFRRLAGAVRAVDGVTFTIRRGETLALVGESGCGKSTTGRAIAGLGPVSAGRIVLDGVDTTHAEEAVARRRRQILQMVFQNPYGALNPRMTVGRIVGEGLRAQRLGTRLQQDDRVAEVLSQVGLGPAFRGRYPFELSGGQRQRVGIARALAADPRFIIADEPISALDVSIQAQVVNLLADLKAALGLTYLLISHDLSMVRHMSDRVAVMYGGRIVEIGDTEAVFVTPAHPYAMALTAAAPADVDEPTGGEAGKLRFVLAGTPPDPARPLDGCRFHPRCPIATALCRTVEPPLEAKPDLDDGHHVSCHHWRGSAACQ